MNVHERALVAAAERLGVEVEPLHEAWGLGAIRFRHGAREALVIDGCLFPDLSAAAERLCDYKPATRALLAAAGLPVPPGVVWDEAQKQVPGRLALPPGPGPWVAKPCVGTDGQGVGMQLVDADAVRAHAAALAGAVLIEREVPGRDLRLQAIGGRLVAACVREPAYVVGDGRRAVGELAAARDALVQTQNPGNRLELDGDSAALLAAAGLSAESVPAAGRRVILKRVANLAQGGVPVDVTAAAHPRYADWIARVAAALGAGTFALDVIASDPAADPAAGGAWALEVNARANWLHHTFSERRTHDIPALLLGHFLALPPA